MVIGLGRFAVVVLNNQSRAGLLNLRSNGWIETHQINLASAGLSSSSLPGFCLKGEILLRQLKIALTSAKSTFFELLLEVRSAHPVYVVFDRAIDESTAISFVRNPVDELKRLLRQCNINSPIHRKNLLRIHYTHP
jgi:hypothetical protein